MTPHERILVVDDEEQMRDLLVKVLERKGYQVSVCGNGVDALAFLEREPADLVVTDVRMPGLSGMEALRAIKELNPDIVVIIMTAFGSIDQAVQAVKEGAYDYINKPFKIDEMLLTIEKALEERRLRHEVSTLRQELRTRYHFENLIGKSRAMQEIFGLIEQVAGSRSTVMVYGKSGTGKELVAKAIHYNSPRSTRAFVAVNCAAIPAELLESELFGHEKGSFTGAIATKVGKFELATGGSLFLDEVGSMRLDLQAKILRALQEREVERVGGTRTIKIDVRVIAATNRDLQEGRRGGGLPRGSLLPAERGADQAPRPQGPTGGYPAPGQPLRPEVRPGVQPGHPRDLEGGHGRPDEPRLARQRARTGKRDRARRHAGTWPGRAVH